MSLIRPLAWALLGLFYQQIAVAQPIYAQYYKQQFGYLPSCHACHQQGGGSPLNTYGQSFKKAGKSPAAFASIANQDSDGDGTNNAAEASAKANPGDKASTPSKTGLWLDPNSLIPQELQAAFPGIKTWLPRDAVLTPADIQRAAGLGARLGKGDDNTIYVPLQDNRPIGTGLVFQGEFQGKAFFLLMTTDRQLKVTSVRPLSSNKAPEVAKSAVYASFVGKGLDQLPTAKGSGIDAAITTAVKKAGTLVFVRLKGA